MQRYEKKLKCTLFCGKKYGGSLKNVFFLRKSKKIGKMFGGMKKSSYLCNRKRETNLASMKILMVP